MLVILIFIVMGSLCLYLTLLNERLEDENERLRNKIRKQNRNSKYAYKEGFCSACAQMDEIYMRAEG